MREDKDHLISSILIGNNLVNILASSLATKLLIDLYGNNGVIFATILMTSIIVIFAEILPKTYALYNAEVTLICIFLIKNINKNFNSTNHHNKILCKFFNVNF